jgi:hypothetical protein
MKQLSIPKDERTRKKQAYAQKIDPKLEQAATVPMWKPGELRVLSPAQLTELEQMAMRPTTTWAMISAYFRFTEDTLSKIFERQPEARAAYERGKEMGKYAIGDALFKNAITNQYFPAQKFLATNFLGMTDGASKGGESLMSYEDIIAEMYARGKLALERAAIEEGKLIDGTATTVPDAEAIDRDRE